nr:MAG TPA: hypothetical protein [Caudoviricetes sp.]
MEHNIRNGFYIMLVQLLIITFILTLSSKYFLYLYHLYLKDLCKYRILVL